MKDGVMIMDILMNIWYLISGTIGFALIAVSLVLALITPLLVIFGTIDTIKERAWDEFLWIIGITIISLCIWFVTYTINCNVVKENHMVSEEIADIQYYDGMGNEKSGKNESSYFYFKQGINNNYITYKVRTDGTSVHNTSGKSRVVRNHTEYTSPYRYFAYFSLEAREYYDVYIPR